MKASPLTAILFSLLIGLSFYGANAQQAKKQPLFSSDLGGMDMQFLISATQQGQLQAALGELAETHAESADVKTFGRTLAKENAIQNEQIKLIAIKKGLALPEDLNPQKNPATTKLEKLQGLKFDKAYLEEMLKRQQDYVALFQQAAQSHDPDIQAFAASALPSIKEHLAFLNHTTGNASPGGTPLRFRVDVANPGATGTGN